MLRLLKVRVTASQRRGNVFWTGGAENIKYKFRFAKKWPIICINQ